MIDAHGQPQTLEFNCRMGDPETQPIMMRLKSDLFERADARHRRHARPGRAAMGPPRRARRGDGRRRLPGCAAQGRRASPACRPTRRRRRWSSTPAPRCSDGRRRHRRRPRAVRDRAGRLGASWRSSAPTRRCAAIHFDGAQYRSDIGHRAIQALTGEHRRSTRRRRPRLPARPAGAHRRARSRRPTAARFVARRAGARPAGGRSRATASRA